jgi:hypothetical protein
MSRVQQVLTQIAEIGPVLPGSLEKHFNVCGKPGCRCKDKTDPKKHGPYFRLSFSLGSKNSSLFVKEDDAEAVRLMTDNYRKLRNLTMELALATLESVKVAGVGSALETVAGLSRSAGGADAGEQKLRKKREELKAAQVKARDLSASRDKWKQECMELRVQNQNLGQQLAASARRIRVLEESASQGEKK